MQVCELFLQILCSYVACMGTPVTFRMAYTNVHLVNVTFGECHSVKHVVMIEFFFSPRREALGTGLQLHVGRIVGHLKACQSQAFIFPRVAIETFISG